MKKFDFFEMLGKSLKHADIVPVSEEENIITETEGIAWRPKAYIDVFIPAGYVPIFYTFDKEVNLSGDDEICLSYKDPGFYVCAKLGREKDVREKYKNVAGFIPTDWKSDFIKI